MSKAGRLRAECSEKFHTVWGRSLPRMGLTFIEAVKESGRGKTMLRGWIGRYPELKDTMDEGKRSFVENMDGDHMGRA